MFAFTDLKRVARRMPAITSYPCPRSLPNRMGELHKVVGSCAEFCRCKQHYGGFTLLSLAFQIYQEVR